MKRIFFLSVLIFSGGCVTSSEFKVGTFALAPHIAKVAEGYANSDETKNAQVQKFSADTKERNDISRPTVTSDWNAIKPWYDAGTLGVSDSDVKEQYQAYSKQLDDLIKDDEARPFKWFGK